MSFEEQVQEFREMLDATINENGKREITGKSLNLAFNSLMDLVASGGGGTGANTVYYVDAMDMETGEPILTPEHKESNAQIYAKCKQACEEGKPLPLIQVDITKMLTLELENQLGTPITGGAVISSSKTTMYIEPDSILAEESQGMSGVIIMLDPMGGELFLMLSEDGSAISIDM